MTSLDCQHPLTSEEIRHRLLSADLDTLETLFDRMWYDLPTRFADEIITATRDLSTDDLERRPRLLHATLLAHDSRRFAAGDTEPRRGLHAVGAFGRRLARRLATYRDPGDLVSAGTLAVIAARLHGRYDDSERLGRWVDQQLTLRVSTHVPPWGPAGARVRPGWLSTQRGVTAMLAGELDLAVRHYTRARTEAGPAPAEHYAGAAAAANLALLAALQGHLDLARRCLGGLDELGGLPGWIEHRTTVGAKIARSLVAIEEGDATAASSHLRAVGPGTQGSELWPFVAFAHARHDASLGDPHQGLRRLQATRFVHGVLGPTGSDLMADRLVLRAEAELLLQAGAGQRVLVLAREHPDDDALDHEVAWVHLLAGDHQQAIRVAARRLNQANPGPDVVGLQLVLAVAHLREGHEERAAQAFEAAVRLRSGPAHVRPFRYATREELDRLSRLAGVPDPMTLAHVAVRPDPPSVGPVVRLTRREQAVLEALDQGHTAARAAAAFGVSVTTVRSQVRSIYKKLGVSRRAAALARAHELGLIR